MEYVTLENNQYQIPTSWRDIKLRKYLELSKLQDIEDEEFKPLIIMSYYTDIPLQTLKRMKLTELHTLSATMQFVMQDIPEQAITMFTISGETFNVTQSLLIEEAQDYFAADAIMNEFQQDSIKALPKLLAVICKKAGESLDIIDINQRAEFFLDNLDVQTANNLRVFFYQTAMLFELNSLLYLNRNQIFQKKVEEVENTIKQLDGTGLYSRWLKKTLTRFLRYYEQSWKTYSSSTHSISKEDNMKKTLKRLFRRKTGLK